MERDDVWEMVWRVRALTSDGLHWLSVHEDLEALAIISEIEAAARTARIRGAVFARDQGESYEDIGVALGCSRQSAHESVTRWKDLLEGIGTPRSE